MNNFIAEKRLIFVRSKKKIHNHSDFLSLLIVKFFFLNLDMIFATLRAHTYIINISFEQVLKSFYYSYMRIYMAMAQNIINTKTNSDTLNSIDTSK